MRKGDINLSAGIPLVIGTDVSSSGPPGACITPYNVIMTKTILFHI